MLIILLEQQGSYGKVIFLTIAAAVGVTRLLVVII